MTSESFDVEVEDAVAALAQASQSINHRDLSDKLTELTLKSSDRGEEAAPPVALESQRTVEHGITPSPNVSRTLMLRTMDGKLFEVEEAVGVMSETIKEQYEIDGVVSLPKVSSNVLVKVIQHCDYQIDCPRLDLDGNKEIKNWDADIIKMDLETLLYLDLTAYYLKLNSLQDLTCQALLDSMERESSSE